MFEINMKIDNSFEIQHLVKLFHNEKCTGNTNSTIYPIIYLIMFVLIIQYVVTYYFTNTKWFSYIALIRNLSFTLGIYFYITTKRIIYLIIPFVIEIFIGFIKYKGYHFEKYIATEYLYNDNFSDLVKRNNLFSSLSEGIYDDVFGIDTKDHSVDNVKKILKWTEDVFTKAYNTRTPKIECLNGKVYDDMHELKKIGLNNKFKTICELCGINSSMRVLEIGFGEGDFLNYLKDEYGISAVGISISEEQVKTAKKMGFEAYKMDMWDMKPDFLGKFDCIIQCGNLEYTRCISESHDKYTEYFKIVQKLLNPDSKFFITCIHMNSGWENEFSLCDYIRGYVLYAANDGIYPESKNILTEHGKNANMKLIHQSERTNDYWITAAINHGSFYFYQNEEISFSRVLNALFKTIAGPFFIYSYLCYNPTFSYYWFPWLWQFTPRQCETRFISPVSLEYILFQNNE
jgi:cyclopropane fatty-acyl-phospholipid synthase-like methyltransferase